jgi:hypothetical protein
LPEGTRALRLVSPEITHVIGIVIADREPALPLARTLFVQAPSLGLDAAIRQRLPMPAGG